MRASVRRRASGTDDGFTLVEVLVAMLIFAMTAVFATQGWLHFQRSQELRSSVDELTSVMRNAQELALAEAATYCVTFGTDNRSYTMTKYKCGAAGTAVGGVQKTASNRVTFTSASFTQPDGSVARSVQFTMRGSASPGTVTLQRQGGSKTYTITVEGLTGRVSVG
jgi:type II secretion system protein H